jgi:pimeloyl-ACP methyl ester carboxylesterase
MRDPVEQYCDLEGGIRLCYETFGEESDPPCLLVMGLGFQMIAWADEFCDQLASHGLRVIRFDNRDAGRSTHLADAVPPTLRELATRRIRQPAYTLEVMAGDAAGLLDHLGIDRAHVVGASMGAMISQTLAAQSPERVRSLTSIMGSTGARLTGQPSMRILPLLLRPQAKARAKYVEQSLGMLARIGSPAYPGEEREQRALLEATFDRGVSGASFGRQLGAILASGNRTKALRRITAPTLVVHGRADRLIAASGGRATARAIEGASLLLVAGMGHDLPRQLWPLLIGAIVGNAERAG